MLGWIIRLLLILAGFVTSWFVSRDALNFSIIQMVVAVILFTCVVAMAAFWPMLKNKFKRIIKRDKESR